MVSHPSLAPMTREEFLAWEPRQEPKWEFDGFHPVARVGVTNAHAAIQVNPTVALGSRLRGTPCYIRGPELKVQAGASYRYPDAVVSCRPAPNGATVMTDPVVIVEITSPSIHRTDKLHKLREYRAIPTVQRYVILEQDEVSATVYARQGDTWTVQQFGPGDVLGMPEISITVPLAEFYDGLTFEAAAPTA